MSKRHYMARGPAFFLTALLVPVFVMAGCEVPPPEEDPAADPQVQPGEPANDTVEFSSSLSETHDSGVSGEVRVQRPRANGAVTMIIEVEGLPYEGEFPAFVHRGTCDDLNDGIMDWGNDRQQDPQQQDPQQQEQMQQEQVGAQVAELSPVRGFADGTGMSQTTVGIDELPTHEDMSVRIHGEGQQVVACADIDQGDWDRDRDGVW
jgi:hypothetical protein